MSELREIAIQQTIVPDYRLGFFDILYNRFGRRLKVYAGEADFGGSPISSPSAWERYTKVENHYFFRSRVLWQSGVISKLVRAEVAILNGNLRILSNIPVLLLRALLGRKTIIWSHAAGRSGFAKYVRRFYNGLSDGIIAYTETDKEQFVSQAPKLPVWVAANSCVYAENCKPVCAEKGLPDAFIYVGRLIAGKKVDVLMRAYFLAVREGLLPDEAKLIIVGDGPAKANLERISEEECFTDSVSFTGHISEIGVLRKYYSDSIASVSPGYVGLSATQSFSFGIPMLVSRDEHHSPEIEACQSEFNAMFFETDDLLALADLLRTTWDTRDQWVTRRSEIAQWTKENYSFEAMGDAFFSAIKY